MSPLARTSSVAGLSAGLGLALLATLSRTANVAPPAVVTTDTRQYCDHLLERVSDLVRAASKPPPERVMELAGDGRDLCDKGQVRDGVLRLRRALALATYGLDQPAPQ